MSNLIFGANQKVHSGIIPRVSVNRHDKHLQGKEFVQFRPSQPLNYIPRQEITIDLPGGNHLLDMNNHTLEFKVKANGHNFNMAGSAHNFIERLVLQTKNGIVLADSNDYNTVFHQMLQPSVGVDYCKKNWDEKMQNLDPAVGNTAKELITTSTETNMMAHLDLDLFKTQRFLHSPLLGKLVLKITWARGEMVACNNADANTPDYLITSCVLHACKVPVSQEYVNLLQKQAKDGKVIYNPLNSRVVSKSATGNTRNTLTISGNEQSVEKVFIMRQMSEDIASTVSIGISGDEGHFYTQKSVRPSNVSSATTSEQFLHGSVRYPQQPITTAEQAYFHLENAMELRKDASAESLVDYDNYTRIGTTWGPDDASGAASSDYTRYLLGYDFTVNGRNSGISLQDNHLLFEDDVSSGQLESNDRLNAIVWSAGAIQIVDEQNVFVGI